MARKNEPVIDDNRVFVCVEKCYFNSILWQVEDETAYIDGIEDHIDPEKPDCWFMVVK